MEPAQRPIHQLPQEIVRLIAAGEVIERPASVVKELIENSIDAGAGQIEVKLVNGGLTSIMVRDDGSGIPADEAPLLLERHTTSKIGSEEDLGSIITLGFRGEALYSIAAVSDLILSTRFGDEEAGTRLSFQSGERKVERIPWPGGTQVESLSLFHATPARRKFLRASSAEYSRAAGLISAYALAYPDVGWRLMHDGRETLRTPGTGNLEDALIAVYGADIARRMVPVEWDSGPVRVSGAVSAVEVTRARRTDQSLFLNGRFVRDPAVGAVLEQAYSPFLQGGRHPLAILRITCDPAQVDVNVHPHKREVRLAQPRAITSAVFRAVGDALKSSLPPDAHLDTEPAGVEGVTIDESTGEVRPAAPSPAPVHPEEERRWAIREPKHRHTADWPPFEEAAAMKAGSSRRGLLDLPHRYPTFEEIGVGEGVDPVENAAQFANTYIIYNRGREIYLIDQHNLHERILYEQFRKREGASGSVSQTLLFPVQVNLPPALAGLAREHQDELKALGFDMEEFSEGSAGQAFVIRAAPQELKDADPAQALTDCLERASRDEDVAEPGGFRKAFAMNLACKSAIKAGQQLSEDEIRFLIEHVEDGTYYTCPHGRPTIIRLEEDWFRRIFKRS